MSNKLEAYIEKLTKKDVCLAFSGGVDSALLLKILVEKAKINETKVYAVTFDSKLHPACDLEIAERVAMELGASHHIVQVDELEQEEIRNNPVDRCYLCKKKLFQSLIEFAEERGVSVIVDGTNDDDLHVYRPGIRALKELGIISPLAYLEIKKSEVKKLANEYGVSVAKRPSTPCMATRLPYNTKLDYGVLHKIGSAEEEIKKIIPGNIRVRWHDPIIRIEVDMETIPEMLEKRYVIVQMLKNLGFSYVTLDLEGFRSGSMDIGL